MHHAMLIVQENINTNVKIWLYVKVFVISQLLNSTQYLKRCDSINLCAPYILFDQGATVCCYTITYLLFQYL